LNDILHQCLAHDADRRYENADKLMTELEKYIYRDGYGPANETMGKFIRDLFGQDAVRPMPPEDHLKTIVIPQSSRPRA
jgi:serine/threonine-protein kinase